MGDGDRKNERRGIASWFGFGASALDP